LQFINPMGNGPSPGATKSPGLGFQKALRTAGAFVTGVLDFKHFAKFVLSPKAVVHGIGNTVVTQDYYYADFIYRGTGAYIFIKKNAWPGKWKNFVWIGHVKDDTVFPFCLIKLIKPGIRFGLPARKTLE